MQKQIKEINTTKFIMQKMRKPHTRIYCVKNVVTAVDTQQR